jgi:hypothetical protein
MKVTGMIDRRRILRGILNGGVVTVSLPLLDYFLDGNGKALAATGKPIPVRFGTWFWGLGMTKSVFTPKTVGASYDLLEELAPIKAVQQHVNVFTDFNVIKDDAPNLCHFTGWVGLRCGSVPASRTDISTESIDVAVARKIGGFTRFRSLDATATGNSRDSYSFTDWNAFNTPETSPLALYQRIFGAEFQDPNGKTFTPSPSVMTRKSVLSGVMDETKALESRVGSEDRARLDQYYTGLREVENQLAHQLQKPDPIQACIAPVAPKEMMAGLDSELVSQRHKLMTDLMVMAITCDQTRVFNMVYSASTALTVKQGWQRPHHVATHEELVDGALGYQPTVHWFTIEAMKHWAYFVQALASIREGDGTLLDNSLIYAHSDQEYAKIHSLDGIPMFTAGTAGGRLKTGLHVTGGAEPGTRLGYTLLRTMGVEVASWGTKSNKTSKEVGEILV